jgi:hypothetical protein
VALIRMVTQPPNSNPRCQNAQFRRQSMAQLVEEVSQVGNYFIRMASLARQRVFLTWPGGFAAPRRLRIKSAGHP